MAKYTYPGIFFNEKDNTIRSNSLPGLGVGAIVMKANKGPVNQRILTTSYDNFTELYGQPENLDDYGHFAAENYLAISNQLLTVRTTMGDEGYAQIQYPYTNASIDDTFRSKDTAEFKFIDNEDNSNLKLLGVLNEVTQVSAITGTPATSSTPEVVEWLVDPALSASTFGIWQRAGFGTIVDLINDNPPSVAVFKNVGDANSDIVAENVKKDEGVYVEFATSVNAKGAVGKWYDDLIFTKDAWDDKSLSTSAIQVNQTSPLMTYDSATSAVVSGYRTIFSVPAEDTLNGYATTLTAYYKSEFVDTLTASGTSAVTYQDLLDGDNFYNPAKVDLVRPTAEAWKVQFRDWDDCVNKTYYVLAEDFKNTVGQAVGIQYREFGMNTLQEGMAALYTNDDVNTEFKIEVIPIEKVAADSELGGFDKVNELADSYGCDPTELLGENKYSLLKFYDVWEGIEFEYETVEEEYEEDGETKTRQKN